MQTHTIRIGFYEWLFTNQLGGVGADPRWPLVKRAGLAYAFECGVCGRFARPSNASRAGVTPALPEI